MQKNYPILFNQNDYGNVDLGTSTTETIAAGGCFDCSFAMKANFYGHPVDPVTLNKLFIDKGIYVQIDLLPDNGLEQAFPDIHYVKTLNYEPIPTDLSTIKTLLDDASTTVTIRINLGAGNYHFVEAVACDGASLHIANPISGKIEDFSQRYGNPVTANLHVIVYSGPVVAPVAINLSPSSLATRFTQAVTKATNFDIVADYLGFSSDQRVKTDAGGQAVDKYKFLQNEIEDLHKQIVTLQIPPSPQQVPPSGQTAPNQYQNGATFANGVSPTSGSSGTVSQGSQNAQNILITQEEKTGLVAFFKSLFNTLFL